MAEDYRTIAETGISEVTEKKSRFIGEICRVRSLEEAEAHIAGIRKQYYDARHHCFAFVTGEPGTPEEIIRSSDDGEPQGTAGKPMLEILTGRQLHQTLIVVTRYFGGTLLGTGGLVRAYSAAAREAAELAETVWVRRGVKLRVGCSYSDYGRLQYLFANEGVMISSSDFGESVSIEAVMQEKRCGEIRKKITELTDGKAEIGELGPVVYEEPIR